MGKSQKRKGYRVERKLVQMFISEGITARRQPMSGAIVGFPHDLVVDILGGSSVEAKARANGEGFKTIQRWKGSAEILILVEDRQLPTVVLDWKYFIHLVKGGMDETENKNQKIKKKIRSKGFTRTKNKIPSINKT